MNTLMKALFLLRALLRDESCGAHPEDCFLPEIPVKPHEHQRCQHGHDGHEKLGISAKRYTSCGRLRTCCSLAILS
jgi:hypothetical protein